MSKQVFIDKANNIKLIATDIDGVWTDARMHYTENGEYMKSFSTYDGMATGLVKERNIEIAILTSENSKIVTARAKKLGIKDVFVSLLSEKQSYALYFLKKNKVSRQNVIEQLTKDRYGEEPGLQERGFPGQPGQGPQIKFEDFCTDLNKEAKEGRDAFKEKRKPDFKKFKRCP